jgi:predicted DNA-binding ribbon-helix-helix protein
MIGSTEVVKRSVRIAGHATSVSLEPAFWEALNEIAARRQTPLNALLSRIDAGRRGNLSSALRLFVLASCRAGELGDSADMAPLTVRGIGGKDIRRAGGPA